MELFKPSDNILEKICKENSPMICYEIYPRINQELDEKNISCSLMGLRSRLLEFYKIIDDERMFFSKLFNVVGESLKNCYDHGPKNESVFFGLFLGNNGMCCGFNDKGDYFKNKNIKYQYENKLEITEFDKETLKGNLQCGVNHYIYLDSDFIEVDIKTGTLFCVQLKENFIAPEGENGERYFYNNKE